MAGSANFDPLGISSQGLCNSPGTPEVDEFLASINSEVVPEGTPAIEDRGDFTDSRLHNHWNSPRHQHARPPHYQDSPLPFSPQKPHHRHLDYLSLSPNPSHYGSPKELSNDIWRQAMLNKRNNLSDTYPDSPAPPNNSVEVGVAFLSHPPNEPVLDSTAELLNQHSSVLSSSQCSGHSNACQFNQPPNVEYSPQFDYKLNEDYSRLDVTGSPYNYNPSEMTFCKRKLNDSYGSDQSSLNRTPVAVRHVAKRGKLEKEFWESGKNNKMDKALADGSFDMSGNASGVDLMDMTWKPESKENKGLDKTWMPSRASSDSGDEFQDELESTDLKGRSLDKTWVPERHHSSDLEDSNTSDSPAVRCSYCSGNFSSEKEKFMHIVEVHGDDEVNLMMPEVCTNCSDNHKPVAFCDKCWDNPYLCNPCVLAHKRVTLTKDHGIIFRAPSAVINQDDQNEEDPFIRLEKILDSVYPDRGNHSKQIDSSEPHTLDPIVEEDFKMIHHHSLAFASWLNKESEAHASGDGSTSSSSVASRSSSENGSISSKTLTGEIIADNLLSIFTVGPLIVKTKIAVVMEMLVRMNAIDPSLFCDERSMRGFKSLLATQETKFLMKTLSSLDVLITAVGQKGFFVLVKIKTNLSELLETIQDPNRKLLCSQTSAFNPAFIRNKASSILEKLDSLIG